MNKRLWEMDTHYNGKTHGRLTITALLICIVQCKEIFLLFCFVLYCLVKVFNDLDNRILFKTVKALFLFVGRF